MSNFNTGFEHGLTGVILRYYDQLVRPALTVFTDDDCTGRSSVLFTNGADGDAQIYDRDDFDEFGIPDSDHMSFMAPAGVEAQFYKIHPDGITFDSIVFTGNEDKDGRLICQDIPDEWQDPDRVTVDYIPAPPARGSWHLIGEDETIYKYFTGF